MKKNWKRVLAAALATCMIFCDSSLVYAAESQPIEETSVVEETSNEILDDEIVEEDIVIEDSVEENLEETTITEEINAETTEEEVTAEAGENVENKGDIPESETTEVPEEINKEEIIEELVVTEKSEVNTFNSSSLNWIELNETFSTGVMEEGGDTYSESFYFQPEKTGNYGFKGIAGWYAYLGTVENGSFESVEKVQGYYKAGADSETVETYYTLEAGNIYRIRVSQWLEEGESREFSFVEDTEGDVAETLTINGDAAALAPGELKIFKLEITQPCLFMSYSTGGVDVEILNGVYGYTTWYDRGLFSIKESDIVYISLKANSDNEENIEVSFVAPTPVELNLEDTTRLTVDTDEVAIMELIPEAEQTYYIKYPSDMELLALDSDNNVLKNFSHEYIEGIGETDWISFTATEELAKLQLIGWSSNAGEEFYVTDLEGFEAAQDNAYETSEYVLKLDEEVSISNGPDEWDYGETYYFKPDETGYYYLDDPNGVFYVSYTNPWEDVIYILPESATETWNTRTAYEMEAGITYAVKIEGWIPADTDSSFVWRKSSQGKPQALEIDGEEVNISANIPYLFRLDSSEATEGVLRISTDSDVTINNAYTWYEKTDGSSKEIAIILSESSDTYVAVKAYSDARISWSSLPTTTVKTGDTVTLPANSIGYYKLDITTNKVYDLSITAQNGAMITREYGDTDVEEVYGAYAEELTAWSGIEEIIVILQSGEEPAELKFNAGYGSYRRVELELNKEYSSGINSDESRCYYDQYYFTPDESGYYGFTGDVYDSNVRDANNITINASYIKKDVLTEVEYYFYLEAGKTYYLNAGVEVDAGEEDIYQFVQDESGDTSTEIFVDGAAVSMSEGQSKLFRIEADKSAFVNVTTSGGCETAWYNTQGAWDATAFVEKGGCYYLFVNAYEDIEVAVESMNMEKLTLDVERELPTDRNECYEFDAEPNTTYFVKSECISTVVALDADGKRTNINWNNYYDSNGESWIRISTETKCDKILIFAWFNDIEFANSKTICISKTNNIENTLTSWSGTITIPANSSIQLQYQGEYYGDYFIEEAYDMMWEWYDASVEELYAGEGIYLKEEIELLDDVSYKGLQLSRGISRLHEVLPEKAEFAIEIRNNMSEELVLALKTNEDFEAWKLEDISQAGLNTSYVKYDSEENFVYYTYTPDTTEFYHITYCDWLYRLSDRAVFNNCDVVLEAGETYLFRRYRAQRVQHEVLNEVSGTETKFVSGSRVQEFIPTVSGDYNIDVSGKLKLWNNEKNYFEDISSKEQITLTANESYIFWSYEDGRIGLNSEVTILDYDYYQALIASGGSVTIEDGELKITKPENILFTLREAILSLFGLGTYGQQPKEDYMKANLEWVSEEGSFAPTAYYKMSASGKLTECADATVTAGDVLVVKYEPEIVWVDSMTLTADSTRITMNETTTISVEATPATKEYGFKEEPKFRFESENPSIATVDENGVVTPVSEGVALINVYADEELRYKEGLGDQILSDSIEITVGGNAVTVLDYDFLQAFIASGGSVSLDNDGKIKIEQKKADWSLKSVLASFFGTGMTYQNISKDKYEKANQYWKNENGTFVPTGYYDLEGNDISTQEAVDGGYVVVKYEPEYVWVERMDMEVGDEILTAGESTTLKVTPYAATEKYDFKNDPEIRLVSTNPEVADIKEDGTIETYKAGTVWIYAYADETLKTELGIEDTIVKEGVVITVEPAPATLTYEELGDGTARITGYDGIVYGKFTIPTIIDGLTVTEIGESVFENCTEVTSFVLPDGIVSIGANAFSGCLNVTEINIPMSVKTIEEYAFFNCTGLKKIKLPHSIDCINDYAFSQGDVNEGGETYEKMDITIHCVENSYAHTWAEENGFKVVLEGSYKVLLKSNGGTINSGNLDRYIEGVETDLPMDVTREGYTFDGWYDNGDFTGIPITVIGADETGDKEFHAKWTPIVYDIIYYENGGVIGKDVMTSYTIESDVITLPTVTKTHYEFAGWYDNEKFMGTKVTEIPTESTGNKAFYAKWVPKEYVINYELNEGSFESEVDVMEIYTVETETFELAEPIRTGYSFAGWYTKENFDAKSKVSEIAEGSTGDKTFFAKWTLNTYKIEYEGIENATFVVAPSDSYNYEKTVILQEPVRLGYKFAGWYLDSEFAESSPVYTEVTAKTFAEDLTFYAKWVWDVTFEATINETLLDMMTDEDGYKTIVLAYDAESDSYNVADVNIVLTAKQNDQKIHIPADDVSIVLYKNGEQYGEEFSGNDFEITAEEAGDAIYTAVVKLDYEDLEELIEVPVEAFKVVKGKQPLPINPEGEWKGISNLETDVTFASIKDEIRESLLKDTVLENNELYNAGTITFRDVNDEDTAIKSGSYIVEYSIGDVENSPYFEAAEATVQITYNKFSANGVTYDALYPEEIAEEIDRTYDAAAIAAPIEVNGEFINTTPYVSGVVITPQFNTPWGLLAADELENHDYEVTVTANAVSGLVIEQTENGNSVSVKASEAPSKTASKTIKLTSVITLAAEEGVDPENQTKVTIVTTIKNFKVYNGGSNAMKTIEYTLDGDVFKELDTESEASSYILEKNSAKRTFTVDVKATDYEGNTFGLLTEDETSADYSLKNKLTWKTSNKNVVAVSVNKNTGIPALTIPKNAQGVAEITATANDAGKCKISFRIVVADTNVRLETTKVTVNSKAAEGTWTDGAPADGEWGTIYLYPNIMAMDMYGDESISTYGAEERDDLVVATPTVDVLLTDKYGNTLTDSIFEIDDSKVASDGKLMIRFNSPQNSKKNHTVYLKVIQTFPSGLEVVKDKIKITVADKWSTPSLSGKASVNYNTALGSEYGYAEILVTTAGKLENPATDLTLADGSPFVISGVPEYVGETKGGAQYCVRLVFDENLSEDVIAGYLPKVNKTKKVNVKFVAAFEDYRVKVSSKNIAVTLTNARPDFKLSTDQFKNPVFYKDKDVNFKRMKIYIDVPEGMTMEGTTVTLTSNSAKYFNIVGEPIYNSEKGKIEVLVETKTTNNASIQFAIRNEKLYKGDTTSKALKTSGRSLTAETITLYDSNTMQKAAKSFTFYQSQLGKESINLLADSSYLNQILDVNEGTQIISVAAANSAATKLLNKQALVVSEDGNNGICITATKDAFGTKNTSCKLKIFMTVSDGTKTKTTKSQTITIAFNPKAYDPAVTLKASGNMNAANVNGKILVKPTWKYMPAGYRIEGINFTNASDENRFEIYEEVLGEFYISPADGAKIPSGKNKVGITYDIRTASGELFKVSNYVTINVVQTAKVKVSASTITLYNSVMGEVYGKTVEFSETKVKAPITVEILNRAELEKAGISIDLMNEDTPSEKVAYKVYVDEDLNRGQEKTYTVKAKVSLHNSATKKGTPITYNVNFKVKLEK